MNTNTRNSVPAAQTVSTRKTISLLQLLALIAVSGVVVSLVLRQFV